MSEAYLYPVSSHLAQPFFIDGQTHSGSDPMTPIMIGIYGLLCLLLAFAGRRTRVGFLGIFLLAVLFTPLLVGLILAIVRPASRAEPSRHGR